MPHQILCIFLQFTISYFYNMEKDYIFLTVQCLSFHTFHKTDCNKTCIFLITCGVSELFCCMFVVCRQIRASGTYLQPKLLIFQARIQTMPSVICTMPLHVVTFPHGPFTFKSWHLKKLSISDGTHLTSQRYLIN